MVVWRGLFCGLQQMRKLTIRQFMSRHTLIPCTAKFSFLFFLILSVSSVSPRRMRPLVAWPRESTSVPQKPGELSIFEESWHDGRILVDLFLSWSSSWAHRNLVGGFLQVAMVIDYRCDKRRFWLSAHNRQVPTPTSSNLELEHDMVMNRMIWYDMVMNRRLMDSSWRFRLEFWMQLAQRYRVVSAQNQLNCFKLSALNLPWTI
jgi:hypothetical protein